MTSGTTAADGRAARPVPGALELLLEPGSVAELRAVGRDGRIASGYFDDYAALAAAVEAMDAAGEYQGIYVTLNPVDPALLARRANRVQHRLGRKDATTADGDIVRRRWLPVDLDPARPSGVSSTENEHAAALAAATAVREYLAELGWPAPIVADSGNGAHLLYRVDLANDDASTALVRAVLAALDARFSDGAVTVDCANANAARIWKCYGTVSRKGDSTRDRPHRRSAIVARPEALEAVPAGRLRALAAVPPGPEPPSPSAAAGGTGIDLRAWLEGHGIAVRGEKPWQGGTLYTLEQCPFSDAHADGAYAVRFSNGAVHAGCQHDSCGGGRQRWPELRARLDPRHPDAAAAPRKAPAPPAPPVAASPEADPAVLARAHEVLERGDPVRYFLDSFEKDHVGDTTLAHCLVMSIASQAVRNAKGLHVYVTGESGKGKSSGMKAMLKQVPEEYRLAERMSNKALYYSDDILPGTVLLLDDIALSEELQEVLKEATSKFTRPARMRSVDTDRKVRRYTIPERCAWWLANVSALYDDQILNRMLTCWVDDSEAQDREVFARRMDAVARGDDDDDDAGRFDLAVCREMWRLLRADGPVPVRVPFARRIGMASVRNRRNHEVLLDLVRGHALVCRFQRPTGNGGPAVEATEEDFAYAARLFTDLHTTGGSLGSRFARNEALVLGLAARSGREEFTLRDVQEMTGWPHHKVRRIMLGYDSRGTRYPGLLDRSPSLGLVDRTSDDPDGSGPGVRIRQLVFTFDPEVYRASMPTGQVWLEPAGDERDKSGCGCCTPAAHPAARIENCRDERISGKRDYIGDIQGGVCCRTEGSGQETAGPADPAEHAASGSAVEVEYSTYELSVSPRSKPSPTEAKSTAGCPAPDTAGVQQAVCSTPVDPHCFLLLEAPAAERCCICGRMPSHSREMRPQGRTPRHLCRACRATAVRREQGAVAPLPAVIDPGALRPVGASVGRCSVCDLGPAAWSGGGVRLCEACYRREVRRGVARGDDLPASA